MIYKDTTFLGIPEWEQFCIVGIPKWKICYQPTPSRYNIAFNTLLEVKSHTINREKVSFGVYISNTLGNKQSQNRTGLECWHDKLKDCRKAVCNDLLVSVINIHWTRTLLTFFKLTFLQKSDKEALSM